MKRVCTLRKVLRSFFKGPLRKVILLFLYIVWFFVATQFLLSMNISSQEIFHVANISIIFETCKFLSIFFQKKANFLMFFIK